jgi:septal ring factor EnvC (AmiA/AmiB activator)
MSKIKKIVSIVVVGIFSLSLLVSTGCSRHPNEEQINAMEEARSACLAAEQKLSEVQQEKASLEGQLNSKKAELDNAQKEKEKVQLALENWTEE